jgi:hypothetical protein
MRPRPKNSCSRPPTASRSSADAWSRREPDPSGGVASRTLPDVFADPFALVLFPDASLLVVGDFLLVDDDRFLDAPHVDMTSYTVPTGCHPQP